LCAAALLVAACHNGGSESAPEAAQSYGATLTDVQVKRVGDGQQLPVGGLPAKGAELTTR
jgi:hypothetical protein